MPLNFDVYYNYFYKKVCCISSFRNREVCCISQLETEGALYVADICDVHQKEGAIRYEGHRLSSLLTSAFVPPLAVSVAYRSPECLILTHIAITIKEACCMSQFRMLDFEAHRN